MTVFARSFLLIATLIVTAVLASFQIYLVYEREPRSRELAQQTVSTVNLTRAALVSADPFLRRQLLVELNETEGLRVFPATASEKLEPLPDEPLLDLVTKKVRAITGEETRFAYARDGEEGVNKVKAGRYDLVLLDVNMPRMSGLEALKEIKAHDPSIIVIVLTAFSKPEVLGCHPVYLAMAIGCGSKPVAWMNDSGFWVICKMSGMTEAEGLKYVTPMSIIMGVVGLNLAGSH